MVRNSGALKNKNRTFKTPDIPYCITWSEIIFFWNISDHDVGSPPWNSNVCRYILISIILTSKQKYLTKQ